MAFPDVPDYTEWFRERPIETLEYNRYGALAAFATETIMNLPNHDLEIQRLDVGCNYYEIALRMYMYSSAGFWTSEVLIVGKDGLEKHYIQPEQLYLHTCDIFDLLWYDTTNNYFRFALSRNLRCAHGVLVRIYNPSAVPRNVALEMSVIDRGIIP